jgi:hypothetical protein
VPSHVASALSGGRQGVQEVPQELTSLLATQFPPQSCLPAGHWPLQAMPVGIHAPAHSWVPPGQALPHFVPSHVAVPPIGASQGVQDVPQVLMSVSRAHESLHL